MNDVMLSDESTAKFEIELVNKQVQKIKQAKKDCQTHYGKQLGCGTCKALQLCMWIDELVDTIEAMRKHIEALQQENNGWRERYDELDAGHSRLFKDFCKLQQENEQLQGRNTTYVNENANQANEDSGLSPEEVQELAKAKAEGRLVVLPETGIGDLSDGYHTFNELYHHRAILFSVICNEHPDISWKSKLHHDGTMFDGMFIVGINTPEGQATYHYDINPYWDMFRVRELEKAPEWDGHTSEQAIERIAGLTREAAQKALEAERR